MTLTAVLQLIQWAPQAQKLIHVSADLSKKQDACLYCLSESLVTLVTLVTLLSGVLDTLFLGP